MGNVIDSLTVNSDLTWMYEKCCAEAPEGSKVVIQAAQKVEATGELFYVPVIVNHHGPFRGMLDSGSMACTISSKAEMTLSAAGILPRKQQPRENIILVGCGGLRTQPEGFYDLEMELLGMSYVVPTLVVPGQQDDFILGSNLIKQLTHALKGNDLYWNIAARHDHQCSPEVETFLSMFTNVQRWRGDEVPDKIGTVKLTQAVTLLPRHEHLIWGRLPAKVHLSLGSTVVVEPTTSKAGPRDVLVGRIVTPLWGDRWVPMTVVNLSHKPVTLRRNCKLADVSPCLATEDLDVFQGLQFVPGSQPSAKSQGASCALDPVRALSDLGLGDIKLSHVRLTTLANLSLSSCWSTIRTFFQNTPWIVVRPRGTCIAFILQMSAPFAYRIGGFLRVIIRS